MVLIISFAESASKPPSTPNLKKTLNATPVKTPNMTISRISTQPPSLIVGTATSVALSAGEYYAQGMKLVNQSKPIQAITAFDMATSLNPGYSAAWLAKARAQSQTGLYTSAVDSYYQVTSLEPGNFDAWYELARLLDRLRRYKEAYEAYNHALGLKPDREDIRRYRDQAYIVSVSGFSFGAEMENTRSIQIPF